MDHKRWHNGELVEHIVDGKNEPLIGKTRQQIHIPIKAQPWPLVLLPIKLLAKPGDRGAGDIIARVIGPIGGDAFKKWYKALFGRGCGCGNRQESLNQRWPL